MSCTTERIPYSSTGFFNKIVLDYLAGAPALAPFYTHSGTTAGIDAAITARRAFATNRPLLADVLTTQYATVPAAEKVLHNINCLRDENTFTITTAHQNNIFTGPLYFIYKILHTIRLADELNKGKPGLHFVPVFYIGSEDADLDELNHIHLGGEKLVWETQQTGAVGRMKIDKALLQLIGRMEGQLSVLPAGKEIIEKIRQHYKAGETIQQATFHFVNELFADYGLVVLLPDNRLLKQEMKALFADDIFNQPAAAIVEATAEKLDAAGYKVQAHPREINLFYLSDDKRERIEEHNGSFSVKNTTLQFTKEELKAELNNCPERFSPNVILRGLYQETILPNIAFIGGGGELAYWLQLKDLFVHYQVPFPVLLLRNSFLLLEKSWQQRITKTGFTSSDFFLPATELINRQVKRDSQQQLQLSNEIQQLEHLYQSVSKTAGAIDRTLEKHVAALLTKARHRLQEVEKKMLRAEKRKYADQQRQIETIKSHLFPKNGLQERIENISYYYALWGKEIIAQLYEASAGLDGEFVVVKEN